MNSIIFENDAVRFTVGRNGSAVGLFLKETKEELLADWFRGMDLQILEREPLRYHCACSRYRREKALISLGRKELQTLIDEDLGAELGCHFCHSQYAFSTQDLKDLLERASRE